MPRPFGGDRLVPGEDGIVYIETSVAKGWVARRAQTPISAEHPGTAIRWEDEFFEVRAVEERLEGLRYALARWDERHIFRVVEDYSDASEAARRKERADAAAAVAKRGLSLWLAPLVGHLPGDVQERMERDFNAPATQITILSAIPLFLFGFFCLLWLLIVGFASMYAAETDDRSLLHGLPTWVLVFGVYLLVESGMRLGIALGQGRPIGSVAGTICYELWRILTRAPRGTAEPKGLAFQPVVELFDDPEARRDLEDAYRMREPLLALLAPGEQLALAERFGFDPIRWGRRTAIAILVFSLFLFARAWILFRLGHSFADVVVMLGALFFSGEQLTRLVTLARGHVAGSALGGLVRPLARKLIAVAFSPIAEPPEVPAADATDRGPDPDPPPDAGRAS